VVIWLCYVYGLFKSHAFPYLNPLSIFRLEDDGVVTTCRIPTCDSEETMLFDFNEDSHAKIILKVQFAPRYRVGTLNYN